ncbi:hypothetical protein PGB90_007458 [Kerria lacca]
MESFVFYFNLELLIFLFERVTNLNCALQSVNLNFNECHSSVKITVKSIQKSKDEDFNCFWKKVITNANKLNLGELTIAKIRKAPKRFETQSRPYKFDSPMDYYRQLFYEVIDQTFSSLKSRFSSSTYDFLKQIENFLIKEDDNDNVNQIVSFYNADNFDPDRLILHPNMLIDLMNDRFGLKPKSIEEIIKFVKNNVEIIKVIREIFKLIHIILTIPASNAMCKRSFSAMRRLKSYLRSTMVAERLNHISILHVH